MSILCDRDIISRNIVTEGFVGHQVSKGVISYGLSSAGYDARLSETTFVTRHGALTPSTIDPKKFEGSVLVKHVGKVLEMPPHSFALGMTVERFCVPRNVVGVCYGKSTYARCGLVVNVTPLEPGWEGNVTLELSNTTNQWLKVYTGEGICQFQFTELSDDPMVSYNERNGKYMYQNEVTFPIVADSNVVVVERWFHEND